MANIASQKKRILRAERERIENRQHTSAIKTYFRRLEAAVAEGDAERVATEHRTLISKIDKAVKTGALHRNTGARKKSRAARVAHPRHRHPAPGASSDPSGDQPAPTAYAAIAPIVRSASVSASSPEPPAAVELEVRERGERAAQRAPRRCAPTSAMKAAAAFGGIRSSPRIFAGGMPCSSWVATPSASRRRRAIQ